MLDGWVLVLTVVTALGTGLVAGVFFAFSAFIMRALARLQPAPGIAAMQSINITVINPVFMLALMGTAATCAVLGIVAVANWSEHGAAVVFSGSVCYLAGTIVVTMAYHLPRNDRLATWDPTAPASPPRWARFVREWTGANHVRTVAALAAATLFTLALVTGSS